MSKASRFVDSVRQQTRSLLTGDMTQSVDYVYQNLREHHAKAAIWLHENERMNLDAYNLHDLILNYDHLKVLAETPIESVFTDLLDIPTGKFNPHHLVKYFNERS